MQAYYPATPTSQRGRDSRSRSSLRSRAGRSSRRSEEEESASGRRSPTEEITPEEENERREVRSQSTRNYASRSEDETPGDRFNVFGRPEEERADHHGEELRLHEEGDREGHGQREEAADVSMQEEETRDVMLPEYQGPGRYVEDSTRGLRRRLGVAEEDQSPEDREAENDGHAPDREGDGHGDDEEDDHGHRERDDGLRQDAQEEEEEEEEESLEGVEEHPEAGAPDLFNEAEDQQPGHPSGMEPDIEPGAGPIPGEDLQGEDGGEPAGARGELPDHNVLITPNGTRYHLTVSCPTLANTRRILRSIHCEFCCRSTPPRQRALVHVARPGDTAHFDPRCPHVGLRCPAPYPCCQMCPTNPTTRR